MPPAADETTTPSTDLRLAPGVAVPESALRFQYSRSGGPGGQNVNKVNTRAQLWVPISAITGLRESALGRLRQLAGSRLTAADDLHITAETERTQEGNRTAVLDRLKLLVQQPAHQPNRRKNTKPSRGAKQRRLKGKNTRSEIKSKRRFRHE
jgi:ribosome-associated protein